MSRFRRVAVGPRPAHGRSDGHGTAACGLKPGECGELWNITHPEKVRAIHQAYVDAGAEVLLTNTFQANSAALERHNLAGQLGMICQAAVDLAREAAGPDGWVLADVGPFSVAEEDHEVAVLPPRLAPMGVDGVLLETWSDPTPFWRAERTPSAATSRSADTGFTDLPARPAKARRKHRQPIPSRIGRWMEKYIGIAAIGVNCGRDIGLSQIIEVVEAYHNTTHLRAFVRPNAGTPKQIEDHWAYPHSPQYMASWLPELLTAGVSMIGGCCGTTPAHIAAFKPFVDAWNAGRRPK